MDRPQRLKWMWLTGVVVAAVLGSVFLIAAANDGDDPLVLGCKGGRQAIDNFEYVDEKVSVYPTADEAVVASDIWKFEDIPKDEWQIVSNIEADGILPIDPADDGTLTEAEELGFREYAVRMGGETTLVLGVEPVADGFRVSGMVGC